jgi:hypothetical protein
MANRDPCPSDGTDGRTRPRHRCLTETTLDPVRGRTGRTAHFCSAPAGPNVRSAPERSALPKTLRGKTEVNAGEFLPQIETGATFT